MAANIRYSKHNDWASGLALGQLKTIFVSLKRFWGNSWLYLSPPQSPPSSLHGHFWSVLFPHKEITFWAASVCWIHLWSLAGTAKTRRHCRHALPSSVCLVVLPQPSFTPFALPLSLALVLLTPHRHHRVLPCLRPLLPSLSIYVTSLLLFVRSVLSFLSHSLASLCSQLVVVADHWGVCVVAHCLQFWSIQIYYD